MTKHTKKYIYKKEISVEKFIFLAFWEAKLLIRTLFSSLSNKSFLIDNITSPLNHSCHISDLKYDFINFNFKNNLTYFLE